MEGAKSFDDLFRCILHGNGQGRLSFEVVQNFEGTIEGNVNIIELLFGGTLAADFYQSMNANSNCMIRFTNYLDSMVHKTPRLKILEDLPIY